MAGCFDDPVDKVIAAMRDTMSTLNSNSQQWQATLTQLEKSLATDGSDIAKDALKKVNDIQREAIENVGEQARCSEDVMAKSVRYEILKLTNSYITTKKNSAAFVEAAPTPVVCTFVPSTIDLSSTNTVIQVSGANFFDGGKPKVRVVGKNIINDLANPDSISITTNWHMVIKLDDLIKRGALGPDAQKITIDWNLDRPPQEAKGSLPSSPPAKAASVGAIIQAKGLGVPELLILQPPSCTDGVKNARETDTDCGGGSCAPCKAGKMCNGLDSNCSSNACVNSICGVHEFAASVTEWVSFGGNAGKHSEIVTACPQGSVAVGFQARAGADIDKVGLLCAAVNFDETTGPATSQSAMVGGPEDPTLYQAPCPSGVLVAIYGRAATFPGRLIGQCNLISEIAHQTAQSLTPLKHIETATIHSGRDDGPDGTPSCPPGYAINALKVAYGHWIDHIWFQCSSVTRK